MAEKQVKKECEKKWEELTLSDNFIFQKFMLTPENCKKVLSEILGVEVVNVEYPKYEKFIDIRKDSKAIHLDVYVKGDETTKIIVNTKGQIGEVSEDFIEFINAVNGRFDNSKYSATIRSEVEKIKSNDRLTKTNKRRHYGKSNKYDN